MKLTANINDRALIQKLDRLPAKMRGALTKEVSALTLKLESRVKAKLSDDVLHVRSGNLRRSIHSAIESGSTSIKGKVSSSGDVKYAGIHEFGGTIHVPEIVATKAKALHFVVGGKEVFVKSVKAHDVNMPERSFLRSSLEEMRPEIVEGIKEAIREGLK